MTDTTISPVPRTLVKLSVEQIDAATTVLAKAFQNDPIAAYLIPDDVLRTRLLFHLMRVSVTSSHLYGEAYVTPTLTGAALWLTPALTYLPLWKTIQAGMLQTAYRVGIRRSIRALQYIEYIEGLHQQALNQAHWYLFAVGVEPSQQGKGIGTALLEPILAKADADKLPCYLENSSEKNISFYKKLGFSLLGEKFIPNGGPRLWIMLRNP